MRQINSVGSNANKTIYDAIQAIARQGLINPQTNAPYKGGGFVSGYVAKIHDDESDELYGTIDVKEWNALVGDESDITLEGYHEGVRLNAIQDSNKGIVLIPKMYSDVVIGQDPAGAEYVTMYSHVDVIQLDSHDTITLGVQEREEYKEKDENAPDIEELPMTGVRTMTTYTKDKILTEVVDEKGKKHVTQTVDGENVDFDIAEGETTFHADQEKVELKRDSSSATVTKDEITTKVGGEKVVVKSDGVYLGSDSGTSHAVLGEQLGQILSNILGLIGQIQTTTQLGPQPPINVAAFISLKAQVSAWTSSVSNFLTQKVNVQK